MAKMKEHYLQQQIKHLGRGESGYTVPWALGIDSEGTAFLDPEYTLHGVSGGTVEMKVRRLKDGCYEVDIRNCQDYRWIPSDARVREGILVDSLLQ